VAPLLSMLVANVGTTNHIDDGLRDAGRMVHATLDGFSISR